VGHVTWPPPKAPTTTVHFTALSYPGQDSPIPGLPVRACGSSDPTCQTTWVDKGQTDESGGVTLIVPNYASTVSPDGFQGYLRIDPGDSGIMPYLYFWGFPFSEMTIRRLHYAFETTQEFQSIAASVSVRPDGQKGHIFVIAYDCLGNAAPGVTFTLSDVDAGGSEFNLDSVAGAPTNSTGIAGIYNVSPGAMVITATPTALGRPASRESILVEPGVVTGVLMYPTP
jgi:hypothetical protein